MTNGSARAGRDGKMRELAEQWRKSARRWRTTGEGSDNIAGTVACDCADELDAILAVPDPLASSSETQGDVEFTLRALKNVGADTTCGACMEVAFTGSTTNVHTCRASSVPVRASGEPQECADAELIHYAKAAVGRQGRETPALVVKWLAEYVVRASASPSDDGARQPQDRYAPCNSTDPMEHFWTAVRRGWDIEDREYFECEAVPMGFRSPVEMAVHHMWKRRVNEDQPAAASDDGAARERLATWLEHLAGVQRNLPLDLTDTERADLTLAAKLLR